MPNALVGVGIVTGILYGIFVDSTYFKIYLTVLLIYTVVFNFLLIDKKQSPKRKIITVTSWDGKLFCFPPKPI